VVGAKGFEPSTSWSRTSGQNHISRCPGVTYWFSGRSLMDKSGQVIAERSQESWENRFATRLTLKPFGSLPKSRRFKSGPRNHESLRSLQLPRTPQPSELTISSFNGREQNRSPMTKTRKIISGLPVIQEKMPKIRAIRPLWPRGDGCCASPSTPITLLDKHRPGADRLIRRTQPV
jgi:hypothetical protein